MESPRCKFYDIIEEIESRYSSFTLLGGKRLHRREEVFFNRYAYSYTRTVVIRAFSSAVITAIALLSLGGCASHAGSVSPGHSVFEAREGVLDLRRMNVEQSGRVQLKGDWSFSWDDLGSTQYERVPRSWTEYRVDNRAMPAEGHARYSLMVLLPDDAKPLSVEVIRIATAYKLYANEKFIAEIGTYGLDATRSIPKRAPLIVDVFPEKGIWSWSTFSTSSRMARSFSLACSSGKLYSEWRFLALSLTSLLFSFFCDRSIRRRLRDH